MKSKEYIENKLNELFTKFGDIKIRYEYRANTCSHLIEVIPFSFFDKNEDYMKLEANIEDEFESLFPDESIIFISEGSLSEIKRSDFNLGYAAEDLIEEVLNLEVGKSYLNREGDVVKIVRKGFHSTTYPYISEEGEFYRSNGNYLLGKKNKEDLIKEFKPQKKKDTK